jgi:hypothetical protein
LHQPILLAETTFHYLQKLNAIFLKATQSKISQKLGLQRDTFAFDLNDIIIDNGQLHPWM